MPDFAMCFQNTKNVFEIARGFLTAVVMESTAVCGLAFYPPVLRVHFLVRALCFLASGAWKGTETALPELTG
jgi:hypothetical protein